MIFERIKSDGLAHNSYLIGSRNEAVVIDPRRDCQVYADMARERGVVIRHILETHRNEDYVVGSVELSRLTGAAIHHGPGLDWKYGNTLEDGQEFTFGRLRLTARHTPGHTDESMSYILADSSSGGAPVMVFTGDALFVDDVGRTDLYGPEHAERLAGALHDTIFNRLLPLGDGVILCAAHGGGSVCAASIGDRDESTLGVERAQNPALQFKDRHQFVARKLAERLERPYYFDLMERYNLVGAPPLGGLATPPPLAPARFREELEKGAAVVDTSWPAAFGGAHLKGAYSIWLGGLPVFAGWTLSHLTPLLLVLEDAGHLERAVRHLVRVGFDRIAGYLAGGTEGWYNAGLPVEQLPMLSVHDLQRKLERREDTLVLDVRGHGEWVSGHVPGAQHVYVGHLARSLAEVPRDRPVAVMCSVGHRGSLGASILLRAGFPEVYNVPGGVRAWRAAGFPTVVDGA